MRCFRTLTFGCLLFSFLFFRQKLFAADLRIVSLAPSTTEWIDALGLSQFVVAVTEQCDTPPSMAKLPKVGPFMRTSVEQVLMRKPTDVVAVDGLPAAMIRRFESGKIRVHIFSVTKLSDFSSQIVKLGRSLGASEKARIWAEKFEKTFASQNRPPLGRQKKVGDGPARASSVFLVVSVNPLFVATPRSWLSELFESAGYRNALRNVSSGTAENSDFMRISVETALSAGADEWITFNDGQESIPMQQDKILSLVRVRRSDAKPVVRVFPADLFTRSGPRVLEAWALLKEIGP